MHRGTMDIKHQQRRYTSLDKWTLDGARLADADFPKATALTLTTTAHASTLICEINKYGGQLNTFVFDFWDWKLEKR